MREVVCQHDGESARFRCDMSIWHLDEEVEPLAF